MAAPQFTRRHALRIGAAGAATFAILLGSLAGAGAAFDTYIYFDGIQGTRPDNAIEISSFSWGASQAASQSSGSGGGAGKVRFHDLTITKTTDAASPKLMQACASGQHFPTVRFVNAGRTIILTDVIIDSCRKSGGQRDVPMETCTISYAKWDLAGAPPVRTMEMRMTPIAPAPTPTSKT
jgi:type VI secretion system secreted protein Hcp